MKHTISITIIAALVLLTFNSCKLFSGSGGETDIALTPTLDVNDRANLVILATPVEYTIDISTPEGRLKLHKISLNKAKRLALTEATLKYKCARLIDPKYTYLQKGKKILRITVFGFPATYKSVPQPIYDSQTRQEVDVRVH